MKTDGRLVVCDYPNCTEQVMLRKVGVGEIDGGYTKFDKFEPMPEGWGYKDGKDLCPDHHQYYVDMIADFWNPIEPAHAAKNSAEELAEMLEADNSVLAPEDILYTNMPEMNAKVNDPIDARVEGEDW